MAYPRGATSVVEVSMSFVSAIFTPHTQSNRHVKELMP